MPTKMEVVLKETVPVANDLFVAEKNNKLTPAGFFRLALEFNNVSATRLDELEAVLADTGAVTDSINQFIRRCERFVQDNSPRPARADQMGKIAGSYGSEALLGQLALCRFTIGEAYCFAVRLSTIRHPGKFGDVADWIVHEKHIESLRGRRAVLLKSMENSLRPCDLVLTDDGAWIAGMHVRLQKGWPEQLLEYACRKPQATRERAKLKAA